VSYLLNSQSGETRSDYSFGETPSPQIRQLDHSTWWTAFMSLVGTMPRRADAARLSDDPVHIVHGQYFSVRDCAVHAIDAAYSENLPLIAHDYEEQAKQLIFSYDKRVYIRVSRVFDKQRMRYLIVCTFSLILGALLAFIYSMGDKTSKGLLVIILVAIIFAVANAVLASLTTWRKRKILYHQDPKEAHHEQEAPVMKTNL